MYVVIWRHETRADAVVAVRAQLTEFAQSHTGGMGLLTIVEKDAPIPSGDTRRALARVLGDFSSDIKASAVVFEGDGFSAAAVRSMVAGLTLVARQAYPHKVFANVSEACAWLGPQMPRRDSSHGGDLATAVSMLRQTAAS